MKKLISKSVRLIVTCLVLVVSVLASGCGNEPQVRLLDDRAGLLDAAEEARIRDYYKALLENLDIHMMVVVLDSSPADLDRAAVEIFDRFRVGETTRSARGVLLLVDPVGEQVRMEIGYDLEGIYPDGFVAAIEHDQLAPFFANGRVGDGVEATVELLVARALRRDDRSAPAAADEGEAGHLSGGGGAKTAAPIGGGSEFKIIEPDYSDFQAGKTPMQALQNYMTALARKEKDPNLPLYTDETRKFFSQWLVTDAQQEEELRSLEKYLQAAETVVRGNRAVIRFPVTFREIPPYFFARSADGWQLDLFTASRVVGFNHLNQWHFRTREHPYSFAFEEFRFDQHGFPHPPSAD